MAQQCFLETVSELLLFKRGGTKVTQRQLKLHSLLHQALESMDLINNLIPTNKKKQH